MTTFHHVGLCPADIELSLTFYRDGIGLDVVSDHRFDVDLEKLHGRRTSSIRTIFLGSKDRPEMGTVELLDLREPDFPAEPAALGVPRRGLFMLSFQTPVQPALDRLAELKLGGTPRTMVGPPGNVTAIVVDPDGVTVELLTPRVKRPKP